MIEEKLELNLPEKNPLDWLQGAAHCLQIYNKLYKFTNVVISATYMYKYFHEYFLCHK